MTNPTHKWVKIDDVGRELTPIGYNFRGPVYKPTKLTIDTIHKLLTISRVTHMYEVYEKDHSLKVHLTRENFRKAFEDIWADQNPGKVFPWSNSVADSLNQEFTQVNTGISPSVTPGNVTVTEELTGTSIADLGGDSKPVVDLESPTDVINTQNQDDLDTADQPVETVQGITTFKADAAQQADEMQSVSDSGSGTTPDSETVDAPVKTEQTTTQKRRR